MAMFVDNLDFIKNRSFEIAWAVFRCANLIKQPVLKSELENVAIGLVAGFEVGSTENLEKLEQLIRLAEAIGEINKSNAFVLFREMDNLKEVIQQRDSAIRQLVDTGQNSAMEGIFTKVPVPLFDINISTKMKNRKDNSEDSENSANSASPSTLSSGPKGSSQTSSENSESSEISQIMDKSIDFMTEDRQEAVFKKVKEFGKTTTKELAALFPDISERTIRTYLQKLCEQGVVARIGTTGPGSYYVAR